MKVLEIKNLSKKYDKSNYPAVDDVSFSLDKGYVMGLIGQNGSGKTTIINLIMNNLFKDSGSIEILGIENTDIKVKDKIGFVYDSPIYYPNFNCYQMTEMIAPFYSKWDDDKFKYYLDLFKVNGHKEVKELSKGMAMKYSLAQALSHGAEFIVMDEPTSGLDPASRREILSLIQDQVEQSSVSFLISSHITSDLDKIADYITFIDHGKVLLSESREDIMDRYIVVKGGVKDLELIDEDIIIGLETSRIGFAGLLEKNNLSQLEGIEYLTESPTIEDLMYYLGRD